MAFIESSHPRFRFRFRSTCFKALVGASALLASSGCGDASDLESMTDFANPDLGSEPVAEASTSESADGLWSNGCSNPVDPLQTALHPFYYSPNAFFASSCDTHDHCYESGSAFYGRNRSYCDDKFRVAMENKCWSINWTDVLLAAGLFSLTPDRALANCLWTAQEYYLAVRVAAEDNYYGTACKNGEVIVDDSVTCSSHEPYDGGAPISKDYVLWAQTDGKTYYRAGSVTATTKLFGNTDKQAEAYAFRAAALFGTNLSVREGDPDTSTFWTLAGVSKFAMSGNRIAALTTANELLLQSGGIQTTWYRQGTNVRAFALDRDRLVFSDSADTWIKRGRLNQAVTKLHEASARQLWIDGSRIVLRRVTDSGDIVEASDDDGKTWKSLGVGQQPYFAIDVRVTKNRIALLNGAKDLLVIDGTTAGTGSGNVIATDVTDYSLTDDRIAMVNNGRALLLNGSSWLDLGAATAIKVSGTRVGFIDGGKLYVKDGTPSSSWTTRSNWTQVASNVKSFSIFQKGDYEYADYVDIPK